MRALVLIALFAADPVPFFHSNRVQIPVDPHQHVVYGPDLPDPIATECGVRDRACLAEHDLRALTLAASTKDGSWCDQATDSFACRDAYNLIIGNVKLDPMVEDPCTYVVRIERGMAVLYSKVRERWMVAPDRGWKARGFIGACKDPGSLGAIGVQTLAGFPWVTKR